MDITKAPTSRSRKSLATQVKVMALADKAKTHALAQDDGQLLIQVKSPNAPALLQHRKWLEKALESLVAKVSDAAISHKKIGPIVIDVIGWESSVPANSTIAETQASPLDSARARGQQLAARILAGQEMLNDVAIAKLLGTTRTTVSTKRGKNELLGLRGPVRGLRYPSWQIDDRGMPIKEIPHLLAQLGDEWAVYRFLTEPHAELDGSTGLDAINKGNGKLVVEVAKSIAQGTFA